MAKKLKSLGFKPVGVDAYGTRTAITLEVFSKKIEACKAIEDGTYNWGHDFEVVEVLRLEEVEEKPAE